MQLTERGAWLAQLNICEEQEHSAPDILSILPVDLGSSNAGTCPRVCHHHVHAVFRCSFGTMVAFPLTRFTPSLQQSPCKIQPY